MQFCSLFVEERTASNFHFEDLFLAQAQLCKTSHFTSLCSSQSAVFALCPSDLEVLSTVKGQLIEFTSTPFQDRVPTQKKFSAEESTIIQSEIDKLLQKEVPARNEPGQFISTTFPRPKPDGSHRMILNLKQLNKSVEYEHFKMDTLWTVIRMMKPNCYMASIDIKDAYYSVPIAETDQRYLKFEWQGVLYKF